MGKILRRNSRPIFAHDAGRLYRDGGAVRSSRRSSEHEGSRLGFRFNRRFRRLRHSHICRVVATRARRRAGGVRTRRARPLRTDLRRQPHLPVLPNGHHRPPCVATLALLLLHRMSCVEIEVKFEDADSWFTKEAELARHRVLRDQLAHVGFGDVAVSGNACDLEFSRGGRDLGIESRTGSGNKVDGNRRVRILRVEFLTVTLDAISQLVICRRKIRAGRIRSVVTSPGARWPRAEISRARERLANQLGTDDLSVLLDQASVRLMREEKLRDARHRERIDQTENHGCDQRDEHGDAKVGDERRCFSLRFFDWRCRWRCADRNLWFERVRRHFFNLAHAKWRYVITMSINLMPMNGATRPPSPQIKRFCRSRTAAPAGRYFTPRSANGISAMMMSALKITADRIADCGVARCMMFRMFSTGNAPANIAGIIAKYFATSFATENVVSAPRVISSCFPISTISISFVGFESRSTMFPASFAACVPVFIATPTSA